MIQTAGGASLAIKKCKHKKETQKNPGIKMQAAFVNKIIYKYDFSFSFQFSF